jgi:hypothetical protein
MSDTRTANYGVHTVEYSYEDVLGLPGVCLSAIVGPGLPGLRISPSTVQGAGREGIHAGLGRIVFENGPDHASRMAFPVYNPNEVRKADWGSRRRPHEPGNTADAQPQTADSDKSPRTIYQRLSAVRTIPHNFGIHFVVYHSSLYRDEPTVIIHYMLGPGLPSLALTPEGVVRQDPAGLYDGKGQLGLHVRITRDDLL